MAILKQEKTMRPIVLVCLCAGFALACSPQKAASSSPPAPGTTSDTQHPSPSIQDPPAAAPVPGFAWEPTVSAAGGACTVGPATALGGQEGRLRSLKIGAGPKGGLVGWPTDETHAQIIPVDPLGKITQLGSVVEITSAASLNEILALGDHFVVSTHAVCPDKKFFFKCLHHRLLGSTGQAQGSEGTSVTKEWLGIERQHRISDTAVQRMRSFMYIPPTLVSYSLAGDTLTVSVPLEIKGLPEIVNVEAFTVVGDQWYAIFADEAGESGHLFVSSTGVKTPLKWTRPGTRALALRPHEGSLALLYAVGDNPKEHGRMMSMDLSGNQISKPIMIRAQGDLPDPFFDDLSVELTMKKKDLWMQRKDAAGRTVGDPIQIAVGLHGGRDPAPYALAWTGTNFLVTYATTEGAQWRIYTAPVTCAPASPI